MTQVATASTAADDGVIVEDSRHCNRRYIKAGYYMLEQKQPWMSAIVNRDDGSIFVLVAGDAYDCLIAVIVDQCLD